MFHESAKTGADPDKKTITDTTVSGPTDPKARADAAALAVTKDDPTPKQNWEKALGKFLGGKLYDLVIANTDAIKLLGFGKTLVDEAVGDVSKLFRATAVPDAHSDALNASLLSDAVKKRLGPIAQQLLAGQTDLANALSGFVAENPYAVCSMLVLAAAVAYASDQKIPELANRFALGGNFSIGVSAQVGNLKHLMLESLGAELEYETKTVKASAGYKRLTAGEAQDAASLFKPRIVHGVLDEAVVGLISTDIAAQLGKRTTLSFTNETALQHGHVFSGMVTGTFDFKPNRNTDMSFGVTQGYGGSTVGTGVKFTMQIHEHFMFQGSYDNVRGVYAGMVVRFALK